MDNINTKSDFPTMGDSLVKSVLNLSGKRSPYTKTMPKGTMGRGSSPTGKYAYRSHTMIHEANGPHCHVQATLYKANSSEANDTLRNTKMMPKAMERPDRVGSAKDFWSKRMFGQKT